MGGGIIHETVYQQHICHSGMLLLLRLKPSYLMSGFVLTLQKLLTFESTSFDHEYASADCFRHCPARQIHAQPDAGTAPWGQESIFRATRTSNALGSSHEQVVLTALAWHEAQEL